MEDDSKKQLENSQTKSQDESTPTEDKDKDKLNVKEEKVGKIRRN